MDRYERAALNLAKRYGYERENLPKGKPFDTCDCPLARATGHEVFRDKGVGVWFDHDPVVIPRSKLAAMFVWRFDRGEYPHLEF